jgi:hypothetical protein
VYSGTQVSVFGVIPTSNFTQVASLNFTVDGGDSTQYLAYGNSAYKVYNALLFASPLSQNGSHTLTVTITGIQDGGGISVDYLQVQDAFGSTIGEQTIKIDDDDPSVQYLGSWFHDNASVADPPAFNNTDSMTGVDGDTAQLDFQGKHQY